MTQDPTTRDIDSLVDALPEAVRQALAELATAAPLVVETTIGLFPFGRRALLEAVGVTRTETRDDGGDGMARQQISLTPWGREVMQACAAYEQPQHDEAQEEERAQRLRGQLSAVPPTRVG
jgi:hypothetical protein